MDDRLWRQFEGRIGILVDRRNVSRVRLCDFTSDGNLVRFRYEPLATPGLNQASTSTELFLSTDAQVLQNATCWAAPYGGWRIYFDPQVIDRVLTIVSALPPGTTYHDDYTSTPAPPGSRFVSVGVPGPVASALYAFLAQAN